MAEATVATALSPRTASTRDWSERELRTSSQSSEAYKSLACSPTLNISSNTTWGGKGLNVYHSCGYSRRPATRLAASVMRSSSRQ
jgi:hypothetical protein